MVVAQRSGRQAIGDAREEPEQEDYGAQAAHKHRLFEAGIARRLQEAIGGQEAPKREPGEGDGGGGGREESAAFLGRERVQFIPGSLTPVFAEAGRDHPVGHPGAGRREHEGGDAHKVPIGGAGDGVAGLHHVRRGLGKAGQEDVDRADQQVGAVAAGDPGEGGGKPRERVAADRVEGGRGEGDQQHVADLAARVGHNAREDDHRRDQAARGGEDGEAEGGAHQPRVFGDADAEQAHQRDPQGRVGEEVADGFQQHPVHPLEGEQVHHGHGLAVAGMDRGDPRGVEDPGKDDDRRGEREEEGGGVGQGVAGAFDRIEQPGQQGGTGWGGFRLGHRHDEAEAGDHGKPGVRFLGGRTGALDRRVTSVLPARRREPRSPGGRLNRCRG